MKTSTDRPGFFGTWIIVILSTAASIGILACHSVKEAQVTSIQTEMRDSYSASYALFRYLWSGKQFADSQNQLEIASLLDRLSTNFHGVENKTPRSDFDPGFALTLKVNQELLSDVKRRFLEGNIDYAAWRLRGLVHNCVACHTHYKASIKFLGEAPITASESIEDQLAVADFLVASRQFDQASTSLWALASAVGGVSSSEQPEFRALKLWLVVQLKSAPKFKFIANQLEQLSILGHFREETSSIVKHWIADLKRLERIGAPSASFHYAKELLSSLSPENRFSQDDESLVQTLLAATILHKILPTLQDQQKREATWLLGFAYHHTQIREFDVFQSLYLEQCIREFPNSDEARKALEIYEKEARFESSGSKGVQMEDEDLAKLKILRALSNP